MGLLGLKGMAVDSPLALDLVAPSPAVQPRRLLWFLRMWGRGRGTRAPSQTAIWPSMRWRTGMRCREQGAMTICQGPLPRWLSCHVHLTI